MTLREKLLVVQTKLNAPKNRMNKFGGYSYRSCEDILEAVKPILAEVKASIRLSDSIEMIGDRIYVRATALFFHAEKIADKDESVELIMAEAYAREPGEKKGMDAAQITGTASSYARKYALNGLLLIDDAKDPDTDEYKVENDAKAAKGSTKKKEEVDASDLDKFVNNGQLKTLEMLIGKAGVAPEKFCEIYKIAVMSELPAEKYDDAVAKLEIAVKAQKNKKEDE